MCVIDFHTHVLPAVDDGSKSVEQSIEMLASLAEQSVNTVVATPHFYANDESVEDFLEKRNRAYEILKSHGRFEQNIILGAEVRYYDGISHLQDLKKLRIEGTKLLLIEMPFDKWTNYAISEIIDIASRGKITPVLAHIDRYLPIINNDLIKRLSAHGVLFQINASSFEGLVKSSKAIRLLINGFVHFIGSDCHNTSDRAPNIKIASDKIDKKLGNGAFEDFIKYSNDLFNQNLIF